MEFETGRYNFPTLKRGDTFVAKAIATLIDTDTGEPVEVTSASLQVRDASTDAVICEWTTTGASPNMTITGSGNHSIVMGAVAASTTKTWAVGTHIYDLEVILATGPQSVTLLDGIFPIAKDTTRPA